MLRAIFFHHSLGVWEFTCTKLIVAVVSIQNSRTVSASPKAEGFSADVVTSFWKFELTFRLMFRVEFSSRLWPC